MNVLHRVVPSLFLAAIDIASLRFAQRTDDRIFKKGLDKEYTQLDGSPLFNRLTLELVLGKDSNALHKVV